MADQAGHPNKVKGNKHDDNLEMKPEAACQTVNIDGSNGTFYDSSLADLFTPFTEVKMSLHKVEAQNRKLKESRSQMQSQLEASEKDSLLCKEKLHKTTEQLSLVFQENCKLNEENARLKIENQNLMKKILMLEHHKKKILEQLDLFHGKLPWDTSNGSLKQKMDVGVGPALANLELKPELTRSMPEEITEARSTATNSPTIKKLKGLEKRHSSPQFFPSNESVEEISKKLLAQSMQEKHELEQQYNQMVELQMVVSDPLVSSASISDFSLLGLECPEEEEEFIKHVERCSQHLFDVKRDVVFMNYTLKYLLYCTIQQKQKVTSPKLPINNSETKQRSAIDSKSFNSASRTLEDSLESSVSTSNRKEGRKSPVPADHQLVTDDKITCNSVHPSPLTPLLLSSKGPQHVVTGNNPQSRNSNPQGHNWHGTVVDATSPHVSSGTVSENSRTCWPPTTVLVGTVSEHSRTSWPPTPVLVGSVSEHSRPCWPPTPVFVGTVSDPQKEFTETPSMFPSSHCTLMKRSESAEANAGSPPASFGLTPDSLLPSSQLQFDALSPSKSPEHMNKDEDRICPMCSAVFPCPVPQDQFETHVVNHFELEEFELLNI